MGSCMFFPGLTSTPKPYGLRPLQRMSLPTRPASLQHAVGTLPPRKSKGLLSGHYCLLRPLTRGALRPICQSSVAPRNPGGEQSSGTSGVSLQCSRSQHPASAHQSLKREKLTHCPQGRLPATPGASGTQLLITAMILGSTRAAVRRKADKCQ